MEVTRLFDLLSNYKQSFKHKDDVICRKSEGDWIKYDIDQYIDIVNNISYGLLKLGIKSGDKIATISPNRPEWNFVDMATLQIGAVHVPIYPTISESDYKFILNHAEVNYVFVNGKDLYKKIAHIVPGIPSIKGIYTFDLVENVQHLDELIELGKKNAVPDQVQKIKDSVEPDDIATLIYTSGTTGDPKGVLLTHKNIISNIVVVAPIFPVDETCSAVSYLPLCHVYERMVIYTYHYIGLSIYYAENMATIGDNIREVQPDILSTVPRLLEKVYDKIMAKGRKLKGAKRSIFFWAVNIGHKYKIEGNNPFYGIQLAIANKLVFSKWRAALGGKMRVICSGGAAIQPRLAQIFTAAKIPVLEGYGLTETSPVIAVCTFEKNGLKFGTVGPPLPNVDVKIEKDGEICVKGPSVFQGYFKQDDLTKEAIDGDGYFHTGDLGKMEPEGQLKITGRKKEIFKTSLGKYISPALIENKFKESPFIDNILVVGENQKYAAALIVPDFDHLKSWCNVKGIDYSSDKEMINDPVIKKRFQREFDEYNSHFGKTEKIMSFSLVDHTWSVETGELTASLKLKRGLITEKYKNEIEKLF